MMARQNSISGMIYGVVDWVTDDKRELGMYLRSSERQTQYVLHGAEVERMLANGAVKKGQEVTASGIFSARSTQKKGTLVAEVTCAASNLVVESPREHRPQGVASVNMKGVALYWDPVTMMLKTFFNYSATERVACSIHMRPWVDGLRPESREVFKTSLHKGKEFTLSASVEADRYVSKEGLEVPVLRLLPFTFRLQG